MKKIFIIITAYNEESTIGDVLDDLNNQHYTNIVVVNDCSTDNTAQIAQGKGATVLTHIINRGQGASLRTGNEYALRNGADVIVHFDADGQMLVSDIPAMVLPILSGEVDMTIGSRFMTAEAKNMPKMKVMVLWLGKIWLRLLYNVRLSDCQCGFRAMSRHAAETIIITQDRAEHASEILIEVFKKKISHKQVPVTIHYTPYSEAHTQHGKFPLWSGIKIAFNIIKGRLFK